MLLPPLRMWCACTQDAGSVDSLTPPSLNAAQLRLCSSKAGLALLAARLNIKDAPAPLVAGAADLWILGYPLLQMSTAQGVTGIVLNSINRLFKQQRLTTPQTQLIQSSSPNSLYTTAWLDLTQGPMRITVPAAGNRFYTLQLLDMVCGSWQHTQSLPITCNLHSWCNACVFLACQASPASVNLQQTTSTTPPARSCSRAACCTQYTNSLGNIGSATTGNGAGSYVVLPPGGNSSGVNADGTFNTTTSAVWLVGRTFVNGSDDLQAALALQSGYQLETVAGGRPGRGASLLFNNGVTLALLGAAGWKPQSVKKPEIAYAAMLNMINAYPPSINGTIPSGFAALSFFAAISKVLTPSGLLPEGVTIPDILTGGWKVGQACISSFVQLGKTGRNVGNGWTLLVGGGDYGTNYLLRAAVSLAGLGANTASVEAYLTLKADTQGNLLTGAGNNTYKLTFSGATLPPDLYPGSLVAYNAANFMMPVVAGAPRWSIVLPTSGSVTVYVSASPPGPPGSVEYANWLPVQPQQFYFILRLNDASNNDIASYSPPGAVLLS
jgi:hypothetical protein